MSTVKQVVQYRAVGVEKLVQEDEFRLGQHAAGHGGHDPLAQPHQVDRPEDLVRLGKTGEQVFKVFAAHGAGKLPDQGRLGGSRRPVQDQVLAGGDCQRDQVDDLIAVNEPPLERLDDFPAQAVDGIIQREPLFLQRRNGDGTIASAWLSRRARTSFTSS